MSADQNQDTRQRKVSQPVGIAGIGVVSGYGWGRKHLWDGLRSGESACVPQTVGDVTGPVAFIPEGGDPEDSVTTYGRALFASGREAVSDALERGWEPGRRVGMLSCTSLGEVKGWRDLYHEHDGKVGRRHYLQILPSTSPSMFMTEHDFNGPSCNVSAACASGNAAFILAQQWIESGFATDVVVNATDVSVTPENASGFNSLGAIGTDGEALEICRPFQEGGQGFVAGEAAVSFVLTADTGVESYASMLGGAMTHDAFHPIAIRPDGMQVALAYLDAMEAAGVRADDVRYVSAHGTGTNLNDWTEATVIDRLFGDETQMYSTKPLHGHCQGAAAAIEVAIVSMSYETGEIPAPPLCGATAHPRLHSGLGDRKPGATLKSAIGMGGYNTAIVLDLI